MAVRTNTIVGESLQIVAVILFLQLCVPCKGTTWTKDVGNVTVSFDQGTITVKNSVNSLSVTFKQIHELGEDGQRVGVAQENAEKHRFENFDGLPGYKLSPGEIVGVAGRDLILNEDRNITAFRKNISTTLIGLSVSFSVQLFVYNNDTIIVNQKSGERYQINQGTVKVAATLEWKFCGQDSQCLKNSEKEIGAVLDFYVQVSGTVLSTPSITTIRGTNFKDRILSPKTFDYGGSDITFSKKYIQNFTSIDFPGSEYPKIINEKDGPFIVMRFLKFPKRFPVTCEFYVNLEDTRYTKPSSGSYVRDNSALLLLSIIAGMLVAMG